MVRCLACDGLKNYLIAGYCIKISGVCSDMSYTVCDVPQGFILTTIRTFIVSYIYVNDLPICSKLLNFFLYLLMIQILLFSYKHRLLLQHSKLDL